MTAEEVREKNPVGIIFQVDQTVFTTIMHQDRTKIFCNLNIPTLGICYGMQLMAHMLGNIVELANSRGTLQHVTYDNSSPFSGISKGSTVSTIPMYLQYLLAFRLLHQ